MYIDFNGFKQAINILKNYSPNDISSSLQSLGTHQTLSQDDYNKSMAEMKHALIHFKKFEIQMTYRKNSIQTNSIQAWIPILKNHQQSSVYPDATSTAVSQIIEAKKEIDDIDASLEELKLKVAERAKEAKQRLDNLNTVSAQIGILEVAMDLIGFFNMNEYDPKGIADFELPKYYNLYMRGGS